MPPLLAWLYPYLPWMRGLAIGDVAAFCALDPPTFTVPTAAEIYSFISGGDLAQAVAVNEFIVDITRYYAWFNLCQCNAVATPAASAPPSAPANLPAINPPGLVASQPGVCGTMSATATFHFETNPIKEVFHNTSVGYTGGPAISTLVTPLPFAGVRQARVTYSVSTTGTDGGAHADNNIAIAYYHGTTGLSFDNSLHVVSGVLGHLGVVLQGNIHNVPATTDGIVVQYGVDTADDKTVTATVEFFCDTSPNVSGSGPACCTATDPVTTARLNQILDMVTLLQRQVAPFAYLTGALHSSLSGTGTVSVQGILGVLLNVSVPSRAGLEIGTPDTVFEVGWINFGTVDGYTTRIRISSDSQLVFPRAPGQFTLVGYTLLPGVTMSLTEIVREP